MIEKPSEEDTPTTLGLIQIIDSEFNRSYRRIWVKHNALDLIITSAMILIIIILLPTFSVIQPSIAEISEVNIAILMSSIAIVISFLSLMIKWASTPMMDRRRYVEDICDRNIAEISEEYEIPDTTYFYGLLLMKCKRPGIDLEEVYEAAPAMFEKETVIDRLYHSTI